MSNVKCAQSKQSRRVFFAIKVSSLRELIKFRKQYWLPLPPAIGGFPSAAKIR